MTKLKTKGATSMRRLIIASALPTGLLLSAALPALAAANPSGTGQPGYSCPTPQNVNGFLTVGFANAESHYANIEGTPRVSQYDVACYQQTQKPH